MVQPFCHTTGKGSEVMAAAFVQIEYVGLACWSPPAFDLPLCFAQIWHLLPEKQIEATGV